jgi:hypothetical protein
MVAGSANGILLTAVEIPMMLPTGKRRLEHAELENARRRGSNLTFTLAFYVNLFLASNLEF